MSNDEQDWTPEERTALAELAAPQPPPAGSEDRLVALLHAEGRLQPSRRRRWQPGLAAALCALSLGAGLWLGQWRAQPAAVAEPAGPRFVLLLYADPASITSSATHEATRVEEYRNWARGIATAGHAISGEKLSDVSRLLAPTGEVSSPTAAIAGYFVVEAADLAQATELARSCPHLRHGGRVELRPIDPT